MRRARSPLRARFALSGASACAGTATSFPKIRASPLLLPLPIHSPTLSAPLKTRPGPAACQTPAIPAGGEGVGSSARTAAGLWSSDEARGRNPPGVPRTARDAVRCSPRARGRSDPGTTGTSVPTPGPGNGNGTVRQGPNRAASRRARGKRLRGASSSSKRFLSIAPGEARQPRTLPAPASPRAAGRRRASGVQPNRRSPYARVPPVPVAATACTPAPCNRPGWSC